MNVCLRCGKPVAYRGAIYCGAGCSARMESEPRTVQMLDPHTGAEFTTVIKGPFPQPGERVPVDEIVLLLREIYGHDAFWSPRGTPKGTPCPFCISEGPDTHAGDWCIIKRIERILRVTK